ncbi:MAG: hypothetical protein ACRYFU_06275 [Janthinobacterium lividum]
MSEAGPSQAHDDVPPEGIILPLDVVPSGVRRPALIAPRMEDVPAQKPYSPEKQRDYVRLTVTVGLLAIFGYLVVFASIESTSWPAHWQQTKEMLQIILPAITGIIGTVIGFYFGSATAANRGDAGDDTQS